MKIKVTKEDIRKGVPGNPETCAIARAVKRALGKSCLPDVIGKIGDVGVDGEEITAKVGETKYVTTNPTRRVENFISLYDGDGGKTKAKPFEFDLRLKAQP